MIIPRRDSGTEFGLSPSNRKGAFGNEGALRILISDCDKRNSTIESSPNSTSLLLSMFEGLMVASDSRSIRMSRKPKRKSLETRPIEPEPKAALPRSPKGRPGRLAIVLAGIMVGQVILYGSSLIGQKILLPIDFLAWPGVYIPTAPG